MSGLLALAVPVLALIAGFDDDEVDTLDGGETGAAIGILLIFYLIFFAIFVIPQIVGMWKVFQKAGEPGWAAIVPIYNVYVMWKISGKEVLWLVLFFVPCANFVAAIIVQMAIAERFGKTAAYGLGLVFIPVIFWPMLGFGDAQYQGAPAYAGGGGYPPQGGYAQPGYQQPPQQQQPQPYTPPPGAGTPPPATGAPPSAPPPGQPPTPPPSTPPSGGGQSF